MYTILTAQVVDQTLQLTNEPKLASGGINEIRVEVTFCPLWDGMAKTAVFYREPTEVYHVPLQDGAGMVPQEVAATEGPVFFGVFGVSGDTVRTSEVRTLVFEQGAITTGTNAPEPTPDVYQQILAAVAAHVENKNNPHGVTPEQIGAAPAGYGYGEALISIGGTYSEVTTALDGILSTMKNGEMKQLGVGITGQIYQNAAVLYKYSDTHAGLTTISEVIHESPLVAGTWRMVKNSNVWREIEWVNPPMVPGVEYRTTERFNGKPVYTKYVECGALPNTEVKRVYFSSEGVYVVGFEYGGWMNGNMPISHGHPYLEQWDTEPSTICIRTTSDKSHITDCYAIVKYVKIGQ